MTITINKGNYSGLHSAHMVSLVALVQDVLGAPRAQATYDPPSVAAGATSAASTITVTGARAGDIVHVGFSLDRQGTNFIGWVSANDTISYAVQNPTAGTVDLGSGTVTCSAIRVA